MLCRKLISRLYGTTFFLGKKSQDRVEKDYKT